MYNDIRRSFEGDIMDNKKNAKISDGIKGLFGLIISIVCLICFEKGIFWVVFLIMGPVFLVGASMILFKKGEFKKSPKTLFAAMLLMGLYLTAVGILWGFGPSDIKSTIDDNAIMTVFLACLIMGVMFIAVGLELFFIQKTRYNTRVEAVCVDLVSEILNEHGLEGFAPVWEYTYEEKTIRVQGNVFSSRTESLPKVGDRKILNIDRDDPEKFYSGKAFDSKCLVFTLIGLGITLTDVVVMIIFMIFS